MTKQWFECKKWPDVHRRECSLDEREMCLLFPVHSCIHSFYKFVRSTRTAGVGDTVVNKGILDSAHHPEFMVSRGIDIKTSRARCDEYFERESRGSMRASNMTGLRGSGKICLRKWSLLNLGIGVHQIKQKRVPGSGDNVFQPQRGGV